MRYVGFGTRVLNFVVDTLIIFILSFFAFNGWKMYVLFYNFPFFNFWAVFFFVSFVYYTILEGFFGRSVAKWLTYCKVVNKQGGKANIAQIALRSIVRIILLDSFFIPFLDKTLHDYISQTEVVQA